MPISNSVTIECGNPVKGRRRNIPVGLSVVRQKNMTVNTHDPIIPIQLVYDKGRADQQELIHGLLLLYEKRECMSGMTCFNA
jgi:hypothetical protein